MSTHLLDLEASTQELLHRYGAALPLTGGTAVEGLPLLTAGFVVAFYLSYAFWSLLPLTASKRSRMRGTFSSCTISIAHGVITTIIATAEILKAWPIEVAAPNTPRQSLLMLFSTAYMVVDLFCFLLPFTPNDFLFVGHHFMTTSYMISSVLLGRGGVSVLVLMALGESTSIFQNGWYIARDLRRDSKLAAAAFKRLSPVYTIVFVIVRALLGPPAIAWLARHLVQSDKLPAACRYYWAACAVLGVAGSQLWTYKLVRGLRKHMRSNAAAAAPDVKKTR